jgi:hypothetical protein
MPIIAIAMNPAERTIEAVVRLALLSERPLGVMTTEALVRIIEALEMTTEALVMTIEAIEIIIEALTMIIEALVRLALLYIKKSWITEPKGSE